ncbi:META domain-containing protein [Tistrella bauzanensis]
MPFIGTVWAPDPAAPAAASARLRFHDDGRMSARGPCNRMFGRYQRGVDDLEEACASAVSVPPAWPARRR